MELEHVYNYNFLAELGADQFPILALTRNLRSLFALGIVNHQKGVYNHLVWILSPLEIASQDFLFRVVSPSKYFTAKHSVKFITNTKWEKDDRINIIRSLRADLARPWYMRSYDWLQIIGKLFHIDNLQIPGLDICSDKADYLKLADPNYKLKHPSPTDVNRYTKENKDLGYSVLARYIPD